MSEFKLR